MRKKGSTSSESMRTSGGQRTSLLVQGQILKNILELCSPRVIPHGCRQKVLAATGRIAAEDAVPLCPCLPPSARLSTKVAPAELMLAEKLQTLTRVGHAAWKDLQAVGRHGAGSIAVELWSQLLQVPPLSDAVLVLLNGFIEG